MQNETLTIGQLAKRAEVGVETVRFYERKELLPKPSRDPQSGYRQYKDEDVKRVRFIRRAKDLGMSLKDIAALLSLRVDQNACCDDVRVFAETKLLDIESKIADLNRIKRALKAVIKQCRNSGSLEECPILLYLEEI